MKTEYCKTDKETKFLTWKQNDVPVEQTQKREYYVETNNNNTNT